MVVSNALKINRRIFFADLLGSSSDHAFWVTVTDSIGPSGLLNHDIVNNKSKKN